MCISSPRGFLCGTAYTLCTISASNHFEEVCRHQMPKHRAKAFRPACCLEFVERKVNVCVPWLHRLLGLRTLAHKAPASYESLMGYPPTDDPGPGCIDWTSSAALWRCLPAASWRATRCRPTCIGGNIPLVSPSFPRLRRRVGHVHFRQLPHGPYTLTLVTLASLANVRQLKPYCPATSRPRSLAKGAVSTVPPHHRS